MGVSQTEFSIFQYNFQIRLDVILLKGIDVSKHQGEIDWKRVKDYGVDFAMIRAGLSTIVDSKFDYNIKNAQLNGILVGVYWFSYALNEIEAIIEAKFCQKIISKYNLNLPVYYDFEYATEDYAKKKNIIYTNENRTKIVKSFCEYLSQRGYNVGIYTNSDYINNKFNYNELSKYSLWLAQWKTSNGIIEFKDINPLSFPNRFKLDIWQIGASTNISGISKLCDINYGYFNKSLIKPLQVTMTKSSLKFSKEDVGKYVKIINIHNILNKKKCKTYGGSYFTLYYDKYQIMGVKQDRIVIGINNTITAAVSADDIAFC